MSFVYTIKCNREYGSPFKWTDIIFATDDFNLAKDTFERYKYYCNESSGRNDSEYILYKWDQYNSWVIDSCNNY